MIKNSFLLLLFIFAIGCKTQKKVIKPASPPQEIEMESGAVEIPAGYVEKRRVKYLCDDGAYVMVFFDNGKAGMINKFLLCRENLIRLYDIPTPYNYEIITLMNEPVISFSKPGDDAATGIKLSKDWWFIKNFEEVREIKKCN